MPAKSLSGLLLLALLACPGKLVWAQSNNLCVASPDWGIFVTDYGYADTMVDLRTVHDLNLQGREYLSGEWANAIAYRKGAAEIDPLWLEPDFLFPDWTTNSNFSVVSAIQSVATNSDGFDIYRSVISNGDWEVTINTEVIDTQTGLQQGMTSASAAAIVDPPVTSSRYVLSQQLVYRNTSGQTLDDVNIYQLLHSLAALVSLYDDRLYPSSGTSPTATVLLDNAFRYDTTLIGKDSATSSFIDPSPCLSQPANLAIPEPGVFHYDKLSLQTRVQPMQFDSHYYGDQGIGDNHIFGKPSTGSHLHVEAGALNNLDFFDPGDIDYPNNPYFASTFGATDVGDLWVAGAQRHALGSIASGASVSFTYILSLHTQTVDLRPRAVVPILPTPALALLALALLAISLQQRAQH